METKILSMIGLLLVSSACTVACQAAATINRSDAPPPIQRAQPLVAVIDGQTGAAANDGAAWASACAGYSIDDQDDPSYSLYKSGYKLILDEKWADARKKFGELLAKYPKSKYSVDAQYWTAYSLKYSDKKKAIEAYKSFLKQYPSSNYYDDAVSDLGRLENPVLPVVPHPNLFSINEQVYSNLQEEYLKGELLARAAANIGETAKRYGLAQEVHIYPDEKGDDPELRMKVEAFQALVRSNKDDRTFELVKEILLDQKQPYRMRETALYALRQFEKKDLSDLYLQIMQSDTTKLLTRNIVYQLGFYAERGDEKILNVLKQTALDTKRDRQVREAALIAMRGVKSPDILQLYCQIAKKDADQRFREMALHQIGQAAKPDDEATFKMLKEFVLDRNQSRETREAALYALRALRGSRAEEFYLEVAKTDPDERMQQMALFSFVQASERQPEKTLSALKEVLLDRSRSWSIRESAMNHIARLPSDEGLNLLVQLAKTDPEERIRMSAINYIGHLGKNKSKSLQTLISLFDSVPKDQMSYVQSLMYAVASIGNNEAVEFLGKVAKTHEEYEVRRTAIQFLGNIGGDKARAILVEILKGK